jgi:chemotaxis protein CheY-P-specific phosphatase CheC
MFDLEGAAKLVMLLSHGHAPTRQMGASDREVLAEVGNILLGRSAPAACPVTGVSVVKLCRNHRTRAFLPNNRMRAPRKQL